MGFDLTGPAAYVEEKATDIMSRAVLGTKVIQDMTKVTDIKSAILLPQSEMSYDLFQDDTDCKFDDGGNDLVITQRLLTPVDIKINEQFCVKDLEPNFTQKILPPGGNYVIIPPELKLMDIVTARIAKAIELTAVRGVLGGAFSDASFNLFDGMLEVLSNDIAAGDIPAGQRLTGSLAQGNVIASFRAMFDALPIDALMSTATDGDWVIYCAPTVKALYNRAYQAANGALPYMKGFDQDFLDTTGIEIVDIAGMENDLTQAILTQKGNFWQGSDIETEWADLEMHKGTGSEYRDFFLTGVFKLGYQTQFPDRIVTNNIS